MLDNISCWSFKRVTFFWTFGGVVLLMATALLYLQWQGFGEQGQINFAVVSHLLYQGYPLYVDNEFPARYSLQHGPIIFIITGAIMKLFGASFVTAKLSGILATFATLFISWKWFSETLDKQSAILLLGVEVWMLFHWNYIYFIRPDPLLLLCVTISLYTVSTQEDIRSLIWGIALPFSVAVNLKIHGFLYFFPVFVIAASRLTKKELGVTIGVGSILSIIPYLSPQISLSNYLHVLFFSLDHGFYFSNFTPKVAVLALLILLPIAFLKWTGTDCSEIVERNRYRFFLIFPVVLIISIIASKSGSGTNHLMPILPLFLYFYIECVLEWRKQARDKTQRNKAKGFGVVLLLIILTISVSGFSKQKGLWEHVVFNNYERMIQDIYSIQKQYPNRKLEIGYGETPSYKQYQDLVAVPVFMGNPLYLELVAMSDMASAGVYIPSSTLKAMDEGAIEVWLIPKGNKPFELNDILFDEKFQKNFRGNYKLIGSTEFFDIWVHKNTRDTQI